VRATITDPSFGLIRIPVQASAVRIPPKLWQTINPATIERNNRADCMVASNREFVNWREI
jgi:hypothetical protein